MGLQGLTVMAKFLVPVCHPGISTTSNSENQPRVFECPVEYPGVATEHDPPLYQGHFQEESGTPYGSNRGVEKKTKKKKH